MTITQDLALPARSRVEAIAAKSGRSPTHSRTPLQGKALGQPRS
jgi:hypothetical protein